MDIDVQNFDSGASAFVDDQYSNLTYAEAVNNSGGRIGIVPSIIMGGVGNRGIGYPYNSLPRPKGKPYRKPLNTKQQFWVNAWRKKNKEIEILREKFKIALVQGNQNQKKVLESQIQSILTELKQLKAQNEDLLKKNSVDAVPQEVVAEEIIVAQTPEVQPDGVPANIDESAPVPSQTDEVVQPEGNKNTWVIPVIVIGVVAYFIFKK
jgi:hypothetical protein